MGMLDRWFGASLQSTAWAPDDDRWYKPIGELTAAGVRLDAESAQKVSAWYRGRDILATSVAMLPFHMNQVLDDDQGRDAAPDHPLERIIDGQPNSWQDAFQWKRQAMFHLIDHGNSYHRIVPGTRSFVGELQPIMPTLVTPLQTSSGRLVYNIRDPKTGEVSTSTQDEIFHIRGASTDGIVGKGILEYARECLGLGLTLESYASRLFGRGALHSGVIEVPGVLNKEASARMAESFATAVGNWHLPKILEQGAKFTATQIDPEKAQMLLSRQFSVNDIARWLGLPPHMLADLERSTNNNIEHQGQEFVTFSLGGWLSLFEWSVNMQLVVQATCYAEFKRDALVRGDIASRWTAYTQAVTTGIFTRNEVRVIENKKKLPGLDTPLEPTNITGGAPGQTGQPKPVQTPAPKQQPSRAEAIAIESAARLLRREIKAVQKRAVVHAADEDAFANAVTTFYMEHAALIAETLQLPAAAAGEYCASQAAQIVNGSWVAAVELWGTDAYAAGLAALALEEGVAA